MAKKKVTALRRPSTPSVSALQLRVVALEKDFTNIRGDMHHLSEEVTALRVTVRHVDERSLRGEKLMLEMQGEQRKMSKLLNKIADALKVPTADPDDSAPN